MAHKSYPCHKSYAGAPWFWPLILLAAAFLVYAPALWNGFVWDDTALVLLDPFIRSWRLIPAGFGHFLFIDATASDFYRPMQRLLFTFDYALFGFAPWGYHLLSILLHGAAGVALYFLLNEFTGSGAKGKRLAALAAVIWIIHPLHTSAVTYVAGSADLLAACFGFLGLRLGGRSTGRPFIVCGAAVCFLGAMLSKESGAMFLVIWLVWLALRRDGRGLTLWTPIALAVAGMVWWLRSIAVHEPAPRFSALASLGERPGLILRALGEYTRLVLAPFDLHMERTLGSSGWPVLAGALIVGALIFWTVRGGRKVLPLLAAALLAYLPISNIFALNAHVAEHWLYIPLAFLLGAVVVSLENISFTARWRIVLGLTLAGWTAALGYRTFVRNFDWSDQRTFVERTIEAGGNSARMQMALASLEMQAGNLPAARIAAEQALELAPDHPFGLLRLASIAIVEQRPDEARALLGRLKDEPFFASERLIDLSALAKAEKSTGYLQLLRQASDLDPADWSHQKRYVVALRESGSPAGARDRLIKVLQHQAYRAESWAMLGELLEAEGRTEEATKAYAEAVRRDVHLPSHHPAK